MKKEKIRVLYIDDEPNNLNSFKALFRKEYDIFIAESAEQGLKVLTEEKLHVIIADQRMPGMTGVEFFESILHKFPHPIRILLTGYTDIQAVIEAINRGQIYRFIDKPWDQQVISNAIQNAYDIYHTRFLLREQNMELQKAYEELDKFVYSASHDLRAPLASIQGILKVARSEDGQDNLDYLEMIESTVNKMDVVVQNIIRYYRTTRSDFQPNYMDFSDLIQNIWNDLRPGNVRLEMQQSEPSRIRNDESRTRIILNNILLNAIRFRPVDGEGTVKVRLNISSEEAVVEIEDDGIGIEEQYKEEVYNMFFRGPHKNAGSGVGLYVVREAIKKLGGSIEHESVVGKGTTFRIRIPNTE